MDEEVYPELGIAQTDWVVGQGSQELWVLLRSHTDTHLKSKQGCLLWHEI